MMIWPQATDYHAAVQNPAACFVDDDLRNSVAVTDFFGLPRPHSGNFADVYQFRAASGQSWAVKCFTRPVQDLQARYQAVSESLAEHRLPFLVDFHYLPQGICLDDQWFPILKMRWVEGLQLNALVADNVDRPQVLDRLAQMWLRLAQELRKAEMAHGDLQHGNVLLVPGSKPGSLSLRLIDYDGMLVPRLRDQPSGEVGHPHYQHPQRLRNGTYNAHMDRFSHLVIYTALRCLRVGGRKLWEQYDNAENLLFREADFRAPQNSKLWQELWALEDDAVRCLVGRLLLASQEPLEETPLLEPEPDGRVVEPLTDAELVEIHSLLRLPAPYLGPRPPALVEAATVGDSHEVLVPFEDQPRTGHAIPPPLPPIEWLVTPAVSDHLLALADEGTHRLPPLPPADSAATATLAPKVTVIERAAPSLPVKPAPLAPYPKRVHPQGLGLNKTGQVVPRDPWITSLVGSILVGLSVLLLVVVWIRTHTSSQEPPQPVPPPLPRLKIARNEMGLLAGDKRPLSITLDRQDCTDTLRVRFERIPGGVFLKRIEGGPPLDQHLETREGEAGRVIVPEATLAGDQDHLNLEIRTSVLARMTDHVVLLTLWREAENVDEQALVLTVAPRNLPLLRPVSPLVLKVGEIANLTYEIDWQDNQDDIEVKLLELPEGISQQKPVMLLYGQRKLKPQPLQVSAKPDLSGKGVNLTAGAPPTALLTLWIGEEKVHQQPVVLKVTFDQ